MPNEKTDHLGFATENADQQRDIAGKGGPSVGAGRADSKHAADKPYSEDVDAQIAAQNKTEDDDPAMRNERRDSL